MKTKYWHIALLVVMVVALASCAPVTAPQPEGGATASEAASSDAPHSEIESLTLWNNWSGPGLAIYEEAVTNFQEKTGIGVELMPLEGGYSLDKVLASMAAGDPPDIVTGSHLWLGRLQEGGFATPYCLPDGCLACEGPNPPEWCKFASGDFVFGRNDDFLINGLCVDIDSCGPCLRPNPPIWCKFAQEDFDPKLDVLQAGFSSWVEDYTRPFPLGMPAWWDFITVVANEEKLAEAGIDLPTRLDEVMSIATANGSVYWDPDFSNQIALEIPVLSDMVALPQDPVPYNEATILVMPSYEFVQLQKEVSTLTPLRLEDYRPAIHVQGFYANTQNEHSSETLDLLYELVDEEVQLKMFIETGRLPAHAEILAEIGDGPIGTLIEIGKTGLLFTPEE